MYNVFPSCQKDATGRPAQTLTVPAGYAEEKPSSEDKTKINASGWLNLSVKLNFGRNCVS